MRRHRLSSSTSPGWSQPRGDSATARPRTTRPGGLPRFRPPPDAGAADTAFRPNRIRVGGPEPTQPRGGGARPGIPRIYPS